MLTLNQFKIILWTINSITIINDGQQIPAHFHITEIGYEQKTFIDCGWKKREDANVTLQVWVAWDTEHRLSPEKLLRIIDMSKELIPSEDLPLIVEYQSTTLGRYHLTRNESAFVLEPIFTNCLAPDKCGISIRQLPIQQKTSCCSGWWCC